MADDLDDEWWLDGEKKDATTASSDSEPSCEEEQNDPDQTSDSDSSEEVHEGKLGKVKNTQTSKKRKYAEEADTEVKPPSKKKKKKRKTKTEELSAKTAEPLKPDDLITALKKHYDGKLSIVERDEMELEAKHFTECNDLTHNPVSYLRSVLPKWNKLVEKPMDRRDGHQEKKGSPILLVITSAALRATQLNREIENFKGNKCKTAKLFAKHIKLQEQVKFLSKSVVHLGLGTPNRIQALLENGALQLDQTRRVILDWSWRDVKLRRLSEIPEIRNHLFELLRNYLIPHLKQGNCKIGLM